jgi:hypothetical protein
VSAPPEKANARRQPGERVILTDCNSSLASPTRGVNLIQFWPISVLRGFKLATPRLRENCAD